MQIIKRFSIIYCTFILILFLSLYFIYYFNSTIYDIKIRSFEKIDYKYGKGSRLKIHKRTKLINKFQHILNEDCNATNIKLANKCLISLENLHRNRDQMKNNSKCDECISKNGSFIIYHHTFWQMNDSSSNINDIRILKLNIMSYLFTQNMCCTKFFLWKLNNFPIEYENEIKIIFNHHIKLGIIEIKTFDFNQICRMKKSTFKNYKICDRKFNNSDYTHNYVGLSDFVRFVVLDIYPGIYTDGDVIYLKDMSLLWNYNFAYKWSFTDGYNTAVMGINKNIDNSIISIYNQILPHCNSITNCIAFFHPSSISQILAQLNKKSVLIKMNSLLFDPSWLCHDGIIDRFNPSQVCTFLEFNQNVSINVTKFEPSLFYDGPFTYHMHLAGGRVKYIVNNSYFDYFEKFYQKKVINLNNSLM